MAADDHSGARPAGPVVLRIKLRYDDVDAMVQRFASNVGKSGLFLPTKSVQPVGTEVKFELRLANDTPVLVGLGRVKHVRPPDPDNPRAAFGMGLELMRVSREGREVILRMIEQRRALGLPDVAIPMPEDIEAARRAEFETQPRVDTAAVVRAAMSDLVSAPTRDQVLAAAQPASGPIAVATQPSGPIAVEPSAPVAVPRERPSAPLMTSARSSSGAIPIVPLAPEKSRPRRPRVEELIDKAAELSKPTSAAAPPPDLDIHVDLDHVLDRARALAGGELEVELATLREAAAAPVEINVEAASAELARQLGGKPIAKRERNSARWVAPPPVAELRAKTPVEAPPPVIEEPKPEFSTKTRAETELAPAASIAQAVDNAIEASSPSLLPQESYVIRPSTPTYDESYEDALAAEAASTSNDSTTDVSPERTALPPSEDYEEALKLDTSTPLGDPMTDTIDPETLRPRFLTPTPEITTQPADALMIDDDADISSFERALDAARIHTGVSTQAAPASPDDRELDDEPAVLRPSNEYRAADYPTMSEQLAAQLDAQLAEAEAEAERDFAEDFVAPRRYQAQDDEDKDEDEEVSELDVLDEADEDDLMVQTERPRAYERAPQAYAALQERPSVDDFASRLDLGDDDDDFDRQAAREFDADVRHDGRYDSEGADYIEPIRPIEPSRPILPDPIADGGRVPRYKRASSEPSAGYTVAEDLPQASLQLPDDGVDEFDEPHNYSSSPARPAGPDPRLLRHGRPTTAAPSEDLEDALAALDVDLDELANLDHRRPRRPTPSSSSAPRPLPGLPIERPVTGPVPIVKQPSGQVPIVRQPSGQVPIVKPPTVAAPPPSRPKPATSAGKTKPPPIPAAARRQPTRQPPVVQPPKRATTDEGVLIDFEDDE